MVIDPQQRQRIIASQRDAWRRFGFHPNALFWSNREIQEIRFQILLEAGMKSGDSLLDVGCGFGDFSAWLKGQGIAVEYAGIDLSPELLEEGRQRYPDIELLEGDLFEFDPARESFDWVTLSGTLNRDHGDGGEYARSVIRRMYETCTKGIAFNLLDARHEWTQERWDLQSFHPDQIAELASELSPDYNIRDGYLSNDFTVLLWKEGKNSSEGDSRPGVQMDTHPLALLLAKS